MNNSFCFEFNTGNGNMTLNVGEFFATSDASKIKKMLKLINENCNPEQKEELLKYLREELTMRQHAVSKLSEPIQQLRDLLTPFVSFNASTLYNKRNALIKQCEKICKCVEILSESKG